MISYKIVSKNTSAPAPSKVLNPKDPDYKVNILQRAVNKCIFKEGDRFKQRGTPNYGTIKEVIYYVDEVVWKNNQPYFLKVELDSGTTFLTHPSQLKKKLK